ncbi:F-box protein [Canna indica]|uniref:F-box protein n=1 Tax=Canna indica TaxID=4628 RepID=A0AAQ3QC59_9LILI|nr:F-box protein [Canna indica]
MGSSPSKDNPNNLTAQAKMSDWSTLQQDLVYLIAEELTANVGDYIRLRAVCKAWRSATVPPHCRALLPQLPWLLLRCDYKSKRLSYFSLADARTHSIVIPAMERKNCFSVACDGWLVLEEEASSMISLLNPITGALIPLPPSKEQLKTLSDRYIVYRNGAEHKCSVRTRLVGGIAMSATPSSEDCTIVVVSEWDKALLSIRMIDGGSWTMVDDSTSYDGVAFYKGRFYAVDFEAEVSVFDSNLRKVATIGSPPVEMDRRCQLWYFAQVAGELCVLRTACHGQPVINGFKHPPTYTVTRVDIFRVDLEELSLVQVKNLGNSILFYGPYGALSLCSATKYPRVKPNAVYLAHGSDCFQDDKVLCYIKPGVYDLEDGTLKPLSDKDEELVSHHIVPSLFYTPSFF